MLEPFASGRSVKETVNKKERPGDGDEVFYQRHKKIGNTKSLHDRAADMITAERPNQATNRA